MDLRKIKMSLVILFVQNEITLEILKWEKKKPKPKAGAPTILMTFFMQPYYPTTQTLHPIAAPALFRIL